jgi:thiol-disulfide isomerase/thioredoxin
MAKSSKQPTVILLKASWCPICPRADALYKEILAKKEADFIYKPLNVESGEGLELAKKHSIYAIPTTLINDQIVFKGEVPTRQEFLDALRKAVSKSS